MNEPRFGTAGLADSYTVKKFDPAIEYQRGRRVRLARG